MKEMKLREVCDIVGVTRRAVQCYEQEGLVTSIGKNKYGYLLYDEIAVERIQDIKMYQDFGFNLKKIKILLDTSKEEYVDLMNERLVEMEKHRMELEENIEKVKKLIFEKKE